MSSSALMALVGDGAVLEATRFTRRDITRHGRSLHALGVLGYGAGEAILGIAAGVLVRYANAAPENERAGVAAATQTLWDDMLSADLAGTVGAVGWAVAILAAAIALRQAGAPLAVSLLLAVSTIVLLHGPPIGPVGLVFFAAAVALLARSTARSGPSPQPRTAEQG